ncbi:MAG: SDR family NAD(P)-dependent oxidoreductase, partial [Rhodobacteraceae bacterium]|nr:SDR family NAD(P)-dependent oxidoreductase [Paracoccaceae bacterium]
MRAALVTGAARRLGREMALYLARRGHDVAIHYSGAQAEAEATAADARAHGVKAVALQADLLDEAQTETLVARAADALGGPLTVLVNNASTFDYDNIRSASRASWDRNLGSNLRAPFVLTQTFAARMPEALRGPE